MREVLIVYLIFIETIASAQEQPVSNEWDPIKNYAKQLKKMQKRG